MDDWYEQTARHLLRSADYDLTTVGPADFRASNMTRTLAGTLRRTVPQSDLWHSQDDSEGTSTLLVLHGGGDNPQSLYRATLRHSGEDATVDVERIDLARQVISVTIREEHETATSILKSRWRFVFEGLSPLEIEHEQVSANGGSLRGAYGFARAVAEASGWAAERPDEPYVEVP